MRSIAILAVVSTLTGTVAQAEVSADLKFCASLGSSKERLACFEAIARGTTGQPPHRQLAASPPPTRAFAAAAQADLGHPRLTNAPQTPNHAFAGAYAAIGGGYGTMNGRSASITSSALSYYGNSVSVDSANGASINGVAGINLPIGETGVVGIEFSGRFKGETAERTVFTSIADNLSQTSHSTMATYRLENKAGLHLSARAGATFEDWLIFTKAGIGATSIEEVFTLDGSQIPKTCTNYYASYQQSFCYQWIGPGGVSSVTTSSWVPSALLGVGVERNFGALFVRLGADAEIFRKPLTSVSTPPPAGLIGSSSATDDIQWTVRGTGLVGYRF